MQLMMSWRKTQLSGLHCVVWRWLTTRLKCKNCLGEWHTTTRALAGNTTFANFPVFSPCFFPSRFCPVSFLDLCLFPRHIREFCDFLAKIPSMRQMEQAGATAVEFRQVVAEMQAEAKQLQVPEAHPLHELVCVYAGCSQATFEANKDITWKFSRTWIEDFVFTHAWVFPDLRRSELGELLQAVTRRRQDDRVDQVDLAFMAAVTSNVPRLLELLSSMPENFPQFFMVHLVDLLYYAGRLPVSTETPDGQLPIRDQHLMAYAEDLCRGKPLLWGYALNYLRAGGSTATAHFLETMADKYCASAVEDEQLLWKALNLLEELEMSELGRQHCWRRARLLRNSGDFLGAISWACWAVVGINSKDLEIAERGAADISEFCDEMGDHDMAAFGSCFVKLFLWFLWSRTCNLNKKLQFSPFFIIVMILVPTSGSNCFRHCWPP